MSSIGSKYTKIILVASGKKRFWRKSGSKFAAVINNRKVQNPYIKDIYTNSYNIVNYTIDQTFVYEISPKDGTNLNQTILYLHGGAFVNEISDFHYNFILKIIDKLKCKFIIPIYRLAPMYTAKDTYKSLSNIYNRYNNENLIIMGDSAGATLALGLAMKLKEEKLELPKKLILISPFLDGLMTNENIKNIEWRDPFLSTPGLITAAQMFAGDLLVKNYLISPLYGDLSGLPPIVVITGTSDILNPDAKLFNEKMIKLNKEIKYFEFKNAVHDFPLFYGKEAKDAIKIICNEIEKEETM